MVTVVKEIDSGTALEGEVISINAAEKKDKPELAVILDRFLSAVDDYRNAISISMPAVAKQQRSSMSRIEKKLEKYIADSDEDGVVTLSSPHAARDVIDVIHEADRLAESRILPMMAKSFFIGLFSEYDAFVGGFLKAIYLQKPSLFKAIRREIALSDLMEFDSLDAVKCDMLEKEIDSFRRESYIEQFSELERKFDLKLKAFSEWPHFVEMSQRRNLMTHNGGCVSQQYLVLCERERVPLKDQLHIGDELELSPEYLDTALFVVSKVAFMLTHTLWRKLFPDQLELANGSFNDTLFDLLRTERWRAAAEFGKFGLSDAMAKGMQDVAMKIRIVNTAIALKRLGKAGEAVGLLDGTDWSASLREFNLACAVLRGDYAAAGAVMRKIGKQGEIIGQLDYHTWPLFGEFRGTQDFLDAYRAVYSEDFLDKAKEEIETSSDTLQRIIDHNQVNGGGDEVGTKKSVKKSTKKTATGKVQKKDQ